MIFTVIPNNQYLYFTFYYHNIVTEDAENSCLDQRSTYAEMVKEYTSNINTCESEIKQMLEQISSVQRTRAQLYYLNQKCEIKITRLGVQNGTSVEEIDTGTSCTIQYDSITHLLFKFQVHI